MRDVKSLKREWNDEPPFQYHLDHEGAGLLFAEVERLTALCDDRFDSPVPVRTDPASAPRVITRVMDDGISTKDGCA